MTDTDIAARFEELLDTLTDLAVPDEITGPDAHAVLTVLARLRNVVDDQCAQWVRQCDRLGVAQAHGRTTRELVMVMGFAPAVAARMIRRTGFTDDRLDRHCADGAVSAEHADAIVRGVNQVAGRAGASFDADARSDVVNQLLAQHLSGATPAEIGDAAKSLGNRLAADNGGPPAAEDRRLNRLNLGTDDDGRTQLSGNLHAPVAEKLRTLIDAHSAPTPQPDGSRDPRSPEQRRADAFEVILDAAARALAAEHPHGVGLGTRIVLRVPADTPDLTRLGFLGSVTRNTLELLSCDGTTRVVIVDGEGAPLQVGREKRLFTGAQRTAIGLRDTGCIKCGAPAGWTHVHHLVHWSHGGPTDVDNGCLLCPACHDAVHHQGWEVVMGIDRHPWLIPPASVDAQRRPIPSYHRRRPDVGEPVAA
ncbi:MAG: DUF222 domain-containing protein [Gordonia sp. (in: high G+C Gram-positive bacteria)]